MGMALGMKEADKTITAHEKWRWGVVKDLTLEPAEGVQLTP